MTAAEPHACRGCGSELLEDVLDLGEQPLGDALLGPEELDRAEPVRPLGLAVCRSCWLLQLSTFEPAREREAVPAHGHGARYSTTLQAHLRGWADEVVGAGGLGPDSLVLDVASSDGALLRPFAERGIGVLGLEPEAGPAAEAGRDGIRTRRERFGPQSADRLAGHGVRADVILVNHALAHVEDLSGSLRGLARILAPGGFVSVEFHHALGIVREGQFDIVCHPHRSYLSVGALAAALARAGLEIVDAAAVPIHGGSVLATVRRAGEVPVGPGVEALLAEERSRGLDGIEAYRGIGAHAERVRAELRAFLDECASAGARVLGYGAPARGTTLLNYTGVGADRLAFTVDRSPDKQGRHLPGCRIPVRSPEDLLEARPDRVLILAWTLADEIRAQLAEVASWGGGFVVALPALRVL